MRTYWTIQYKEAWEQAKHKGILTGNAAWAIEGYEKAYQWMIGQMVKRLACEWCFPVWVWTERPDLRRRWDSEKGKVFILLQAEIEEKRVLLSDYHAWHSVLNNSPLEVYEGEKIDLQESWERIFDMELLRNTPYLTWPGEQYSIELQGVTPFIPVENLQEIKTFVIR
ncbi:DUF3841 domain-containing protein [Rhodocytophaga rosea]|uniref:DUF3841 domain-containing protein n=1 Tax=Rhodocytophaga rosea TaxID=2704465 RepID=A0A6C0GPS5_9BACT|nr:DUF3841 domain-containing protein [Rhodocytophaga rosea]QHT70041.1 DUF3841 domain-containing protein [Rhodocytophaga rosea]